MIGPIQKPTVPDVLPLARDYYARDGNGTGGSLHVVLEDGNLADAHILFCWDYAEERGDVEGAHLARVLLHMSKTQRRKLYAQPLSPSSRAYAGLSTRAEVLEATLWLARPVRIILL